MAFVARARNTTSTTNKFSTVALQTGATSSHGYPYNRTNAAFSSIQQNMVTSSSSTQNLVTNDLWTHVVVTWDTDSSLTYSYGSSGTLTGLTKIYINGELRNIGQGDGIPDDTQQASPVSLITRTAELTTMYVGSVSPAYHTPAKASYDGIGIWTSVLDASNVTAIYNSGNPTNLATNSGNYTNSGNLVGYWKMDGEVSSGSNTVEDSSTNSNTLNLANGAVLNPSASPATSAKASSV